MKDNKNQNKVISEVEFLRAIQSCHSVRDTKAKKALENIEEIKKDLQKINEVEGWK